MWVEVAAATVDVIAASSRNSTWSLLQRPCTRRPLFVVHVVVSGSSEAMRNVILSHQHKYDHLQQQ